jgi:hypothetical protein
MSEIVQDEPRVASLHTKWMPGFLHDIRELGEEIGFANAIHTTLEDAGITVNVEGDFDQLKEHPKGILFVGDHQTRWEFVAVADMISQMNRSDILNIAKFYVQRKVHMALGHQAAADHAAPVYPRILARDRPDFLNYEFFNRLVFRKHLLSFSESLDANTHSLARASRALADGGAVNIHPTGVIDDATTRPWRSGVGKIIQNIPEEQRSDVLLAPYSLAPLSRARFFGAVAMRGFSFLGRPQTMEVKLGSLQLMSDLVDELPGEERENPEAITARLRAHFLKDFANQ